VISAHSGVMRAVGRARNRARQSVTSEFEAMKPGDVVVTATLARSCVRTPNLQALPVPPSCTEIPNQWLVVVVISR
jgi:hypothetical protein